MAKRDNTERRTDKPCNANFHPEKEALKPCGEIFLAKGEMFLSAALFASGCGFGLETFLSDLCTSH